MKEDDWIDTLFIANTRDHMLCFSNRGRVYWIKVYEVPRGSRGSRGRPIVNMFPLQDGEKINVVLPLTGEYRSFPADHYVFMSTRDRKSTRLNSSHQIISYAVFCLKKKNSN